MRISKEHIRKFKKIRDKYLRVTAIPEKNDWKGMQNNTIWQHLFVQVMVVGRASPADEFYEHPELRKRVSYEQLLAFNNEDRVRKRIHSVLKATGTRYVGPDIEKDKKAKALTRVFKRLRNFKGGPKALLRIVSQFGGENRDMRRIKYLMAVFRGGCFIQSKGARDFLMGIGLVRNAIAIDIRVKTVLENAGITFPEGFEKKPAVYDRIEERILNKICKPLGLKGVQFDRMLFRNYEYIKEDLQNDS